MLLPSMGLYAVRVPSGPAGVCTNRPSWSTNTIMWLPSARRVLMEATKDTCTHKHTATAQMHALW